MFFLLRHLRPHIFLLTRDLKKNQILSPWLHNLKVNFTVNAVTFGINAKKELSLSNDSIKKFIKFVIKDFEKRRPGTGDFISEQACGEVSRLLKTRLTIEESMRSLEDLVGQDPEMRKLGEEEYSSYEAELNKLDDELLNCILCNVGHDNCNDIILELTTGVGGQESMLFAKDLLDMYLGYLEYLGFGYEIINQDSTMGSGGIRHASIAISGDRALEILRHEGGVHRVQRIPATEKSGRVHTSTVSVAILPQPSDIEVDLRDKDLRIETKKASGAGGQHVNTTDSAVRITHLPTKISVECQTDRSQIKNRRVAMLRLRTMIYEKQLNEQRESSSELRRKQFGLGFRNEKIRTYNFNQDRITDHRIADGTMHNLKGFLEGGQVLRELQKKLQKDLQIKTFQELIQRAIG